MRKPLLTRLKNVPQPTQLRFKPCLPVSDLMLLQDSRGETVWVKPHCPFVLLGPGYNTPPSGSALASLYVCPHFPQNPGPRNEPGTATFFFGYPHLVRKRLSWLVGTPMQYTKPVTQKSIPETCMILLTNVTSINFLRKRVSDARSKWGFHTSILTAHRVLASV